MGRYRWFAAAAGITLLYAIVSVQARHSLGLTVFADGFWIVIVLATAVAFGLNALRRSREECSFWALMSLGFLMWSFNQGVWAYREVVLQGSMPTPYFVDIVLFLHVVPLIAAVASRPDKDRETTPTTMRTLHFLMLLVWWIFLYAFLVFPYQYVTVDLDIYNFLYLRLYETENFLLLAILGFGVWTSSGGWRRLYGHLLGGVGIQICGMMLLERAVTARTYYSGSIYDVLPVGGVLWMGAAAWTARDWELPRTRASEGWRGKRIMPQLAMAAILSMPPLAAWTLFEDQSPRPCKTFRLFAVLSAMLVLGAFAFLRQYLQDQALLTLLQESRSSYETQLRLQSHLVQKEKLASLGNLVAGAAREIREPLSAIALCSDELHKGASLNQQQDGLVRKISAQATRTRDLVSDLLSFAQQTPGEKVILDLGPILYRSTHMIAGPQRDAKVRIEVSLKELPRIQGNAQQLLQAFMEIIENAKEALEEKGGGTLQISAKSNAQEVVVHFSDDGPGIKEPQRVFDPFYTTKPIGKGTGLGLSVVYGIIQDHGGQISCHNNPAGGAVFTLRFPVAAEVAAQAAASGMS